MASILVIKLSALGDLFFALPAMQAIRRHHPEDRLVLLTAERFVPLMQRAGLFDEVWGDRRPRWWQLGALLDLRKRLLTGGFTRVYDLQWSQRSDLYLGLLKQKAETFGATSQARHVFAGRRAAVPIRERQAAFLKLAGIAGVPPPDLDFLAADISRFGLTGRYALLVPGSSRGNEAKRWPGAHYAALARALLARDLRPVFVCGPDERDLAGELIGAVPQGLDFHGSLDEIASLARGAAVIVGNDSGPTHLAALTGCPVVMLFGPASNQAKTRPVVPVSRLLNATPLSSLPVELVLDAALDIAR